MPRTAHPATPSHDAIAFRPGVWTEAGSALGEELAAFCQSGISIIVASRAADGQPIAGQALAARLESPECIRVLLERSGNDGLIKAVETGGGIAATFSLPSTHRSIQLKAQSAHVEQTTPEDFAALEQQLALFAAELVDVGYDAAFAATYCAYAAERVMALVFRPGSAFVQTPGPGAGAAITS